MTRTVICLLCGLLLAGCATRPPESVQQPADNSIGVLPETPVAPGSYEVFGKSYRVLPESKGYLEIGVASWYGQDFQGNLTANGDTYDMYALTAAHKSLPLPTYVKVTNLNNQRQLIVKVNDRGPFYDDRLIDLSYRAAMDLGFAEHGTTPVVVEALDDLNYPPVTGKGGGAQVGQAYYLQLGAFAERKGAERLVKDVARVMAHNELGSVEINILPEGDETKVLHKVWLGPVFSAGERDRIVALVEEAELAKPIRVQLH